MKAAASSCRTWTNLMSCWRRRSASMMPLMPSPGRPNTTCTPQSWSTSTKTSLAFSAIAQASIGFARDRTGKPVGRRLVPPGATAPARATRNALLVLLRLQARDQRHQVLGVLFFLLEDALDEPSLRRIVVAEPADDLRIGLDRDALGHQVLLDHRDEVVAFDVIRVAARRQPLGAAIGLAVQLGDALGHPVGVFLFFLGVLQELGLHRLRMDAVGRVVVPLVPQHAHDLGGEHLVQYFHHLLVVALVSGRDGALVDGGAGALADSLAVGHEWLHGVFLASREFAASSQARGGAGCAPITPRLRQGSAV